MRKEGIVSAKKNGKNGKASDPAVSYDEFKDFEGQKYTGMKIGRGHTWKYDAGEWRRRRSRRTCGRSATR